MYMICVSCMVCTSMYACRILGPPYFYRLIATCFACCWHASCMHACMRCLSCCCCVRVVRVNQAACHVRMVHYRFVGWRRYFEAKAVFNAHALSFVRALEHAMPCINGMYSCVYASYIWYTIRSTYCTCIIYINVECFHAAGVPSWWISAIAHLFPLTY